MLLHGHSSEIVTRNSGLCVSQYCYEHLPIHEGWIQNYVPHLPAYDGDDIECADGHHWGSFFKIQHNFMTSWILHYLNSYQQYELKNTFDGMWKIPQTMKEFWLLCVMKIHPATCHCAEPDESTEILPYYFVNFR